MLFVCMCIVYIICSFVDIIMCVLCILYIHVCGDVCVYMYMLSLSRQDFALQKCYYY